MVVGTIGVAYLTVLDRARGVSRSAFDRHVAAHYDWFVKVIEKMGRPNNHQFFVRIAERKDDAGAFLNWCLCILKGTPDLAWFRSEAIKAYGDPTTSQPHLLKIVEEFE